MSEGTQCHPLAEAVSLLVSSIRRLRTTSTDNGPTGARTEQARAALRQAPFQIPYRTLLQEPRDDLVKILHGIQPLGEIAAALGTVEGLLNDAHPAEWKYLRLLFQQLLASRACDMTDCVPNAAVSMQGCPSAGMRYFKPRPPAEELLDGLLKAVRQGDPPLARHSDDFRSVNWYGTDYTFTPTQAGCVKVLWKNWENGTPEVGQDTILEHPEVEAESKRLVDVFKGHPAWGTMIVPGRKGTYRLEPPT